MSDSERSSFNDPGAQIDRQMQQLFQAVHINMDPTISSAPDSTKMGPGAHIDRRLSDLIEAVKELKELHLPQSSLNRTEVFNTETKDDFIDEYNNGDMDEEDDYGSDYDEYIGDNAQQLEPSSPPPALHHRAPSNVEPIDEREVVEEAIKDAIAKTTQSLQQAIEHGESKLDEVLEKGQQCLHEGIQQALEHLRETSRPPTPSTRPNGVQQPSNNVNYPQSNVSASGYNGESSEAES
jgi:hypothetical protein